MILEGHEEVGGTFLLSPTDALSACGHLGLGEMEVGNNVAMLVLLGRDI